MKNCGIDDQLIKDITRIILSVKDVEQIIVFGSRATNTFSERSDIDIALLSHELSGTDINLIKHELDESLSTPLKFDVLHYYQLEKEDLKKNIIKEGKVIYDRKAD